MWKKVLAVMGILADEMAILVILAFILPAMGINVPPKIIALLIVILLVKDVVFIPLLLPVLEKRAITGREALLGERARVVEELSPQGLVKLGSELWRAECLNGSAQEGEDVVVVGVRGNVLLVERRTRERDV